MIEVKPFENETRNRIEIFNEIYVLFYGILMVLLTDYLLDPLLKYNIGWMILAMFLSVSIINLIYILSKLIPLLKKYYPKLKLYLKRIFKNKQD